MPKLSFDCRISTLRRPQSSTAFPALMRSVAIVTQLRNLLMGTAPNSDYRSARSWWSDTECTWNRGTSRPVQSTSALELCVASRIANEQLATCSVKHVRQHHTAASILGLR
jgi:hypothetical protein